MKNRVIGYIRTSTGKQDVENQELEIRRYLGERNLHLDEIIRVEGISSRRSEKTRQINQLFKKLNKEDTLVITELSRLGRSTSEVINLVNQLLEKEIRLIIIKHGLNLDAHSAQSKVLITLFSLLSELERDLISVRTKEALESKKQKGIKLGKPVGTIQKSKFDEHLDQIKGQLKNGVSVRRISQNLGLKNHIGLNNYINKRKIKDNL